MPANLHSDKTSSVFAPGHALAEDAPRKVHDWLTSLPITASNKLCPRFDSHQPQVKQNGKTKREQEFLLGRKCAESQLHALGEFSNIEVNEDRSPAWPQGFVGSISHSDKWVWASVARVTDLRSIGIDTEIVTDAETENELRTEIATEDEWKIAAATGLNARQQFSVVFSAKESFYKCWYPTNPRFFGFADATITEASSQHLKIQTARSNPNFGTGPTELNVFFLVNKSDVFTITWMEHE